MRSSERYSTLATTKTTPTLADIEAARERIGEHARVTPVYGSDTLWRETGRVTVLKAENLQRTGSFKVRGAVNKLATLSPEERAAGVIAASAGNHGQAVAWAARELGIQATIFMPQDAPMAKVEPTLTYGGAVVLGGAGFDEALADAMRRARGDRRDVRPCVRGRARDRRPGDDRPRARRAGAGRRHRADPGRRRRSCRRDRDRAARAPPEDPARRRSGASATATRSPTGSPSSSPAS